VKTIIGEGSLGEAGMRVKTAGIRTWLVLLAALLAASGCASEARIGAMTVPESPDTIIGKSSPLYSAIEVGAVTGGSATNPLWQSTVTNDNFRAALEQSLALHAMKAPDRGRYLINAELVSLDRPFAAFDMTVTAKVHYTVLAAASRTVRLDTIMETPFTADFSDAFLGVERLRIANEGAMRENIDAIIKRLIDAAQPGQKLSL
jgi:hypothetical protein